MSDESGRRPGPWDAPPERRPAPSPPRPANDRPSPPLDQGQHPAVAIGGTLLFIGFLWYLTNSLTIALAVIFGLFVHEYGHVLAMNRLGCGPARIYIIPFLGGVARSQRLPTSEWDGVLISLAGPAFGLLATLPFFVLYAATGQAIWMDAVFVICFINLINLAPAPPLDGSHALGPVLSKISPWLERGVMLAIGAVVVVWAMTRGSYIFGVFVAFALFMHLRQGIRPIYGRELSTGESFRSVGLFLVTAIGCVGVIVAGSLFETGDPVRGWLMLLQNLRIVQ